MIKESGRVVAIEADSLWVETIRQSTCGTCAAQKGCGHGLLNKARSGQRNHIRVLLGELSAADFAVNDEVDISIPEQVLVVGALIVYLLPLITMLATALLVSQRYPSDVVTFLAAVAGFVLGVGFVRYHASVNRNNQNFQPLVLAKRQPVETNAVQWLNPV